MTDPNDTQAAELRRAVTVLRGVLAGIDECGSLVSTEPLERQYVALLVAGKVIEALKEPLFEEDASGVTTPGGVR